VKWINYHHLIYFKTIATVGTISAASKFLNVGQPALSSQLKSLEEYFGVNLFDRKNRRLHLTEAGHVVLEYASKIDDLGQELVQVIQRKSFSSEVSPSLSMGVLDSIPKHLICDIVDFAHKKTGCYLSIFENTKPALLRELEAHKIEAIISDHEATSLERKKVISKRIINRPISAYASPEYARLKRGFPQSLEGVPCIVPTRHSKIRHDIEHFFELNNITPKYIAQTQDTSLQKILSAKGDGVIFLPVFSTKELVQEKKLIALGKLRNVYAEYYLVYSKRFIQNPALDLIINQDFQKMKLG